MIDFNQIKLSPGLKYTLRSMPRGKNYEKPITSSCQIPYYTVTVDSESNCMICHCDGWLPIPVGKVEEFNSIDEVLNSPVAKALQQDIDQKKFTWCAVEHCGILHHDNLKNVYNLNIHIDDSCNLACPSCRREIRMTTSGPDYDRRVKDTNRILTWLEKFEHPIDISLGGNGDALASFIFRNLIKNYHYRPKQKFSIATNGLLLEKVMSDSNILPAVSVFSISVDAASKTVYENVRRPGKWEILLENLEWLFNKNLDATVRLNFVVQNANYRDLPAFVELCQRYGCIGSIQPLNDWGTWNSKPVPTPDAFTVANGNYPDHDVADPAHQNHKHFVEILNVVRQQNHKFMLFSNFFDQFQ